MERKVQNFIKREVAIWSEMESYYDQKGVLFGGLSSSS